MKKILIITLLNFLFINCKSQTQTVDILDSYGVRATVGTYIKDVNNLLDPYAGTWIYNNGSKYIKLVLTKKIKIYNGKIYNDVVVGGIEYKENNTTKVNTLSHLNNNYTNYIKYSISGKVLMTNDFPPNCFDCLPNELRLRASYHELDPDTSFGTMVLRKISVNGQNALKVNLMGEIVYYKEGTTPPLDFKLPTGEYIFIKQ